MNKTFYQTSMMSALIAGLYEGDFTIGQLLNTVTLVSVLLMILMVK